MAGMFEGADIESLRGGDLFTGTLLPQQVSDDLLHRDMVVVQPMRPVETPYGIRCEPAGDAAYCYCSFEPRINKNSTFSKNWAQDTSPQSYGGLREDSMGVLLAPEWHGDIWTRFWFENACYEVDGPPSHMRHASDRAEHWNITARRIGSADLGDVKVPVPPDGSHVWGT